MPWLSCYVFLFYKSYKKLKLYYLTLSEYFVTINNIIYAYLYTIYNHGPVFTHGEWGDLSPEAFFIHPLEMQDPHRDSRLISKNIIYTVIIRPCQARGKTVNTGFQQEWNQCTIQSELASQKTASRRGVNWAWQSRATAMP